MATARQIPSPHTITEVLRRFEDERLADEARHEAFYDDDNPHLGPSVPLSGSIRGNMNGLLSREAPSKDHTIPHGVICHAELDAYAPWDDERWGWSSWPGGGLEWWRTT